MAQTKATKEITHALEWLAAEFKFLKQLDQDLEKIDQEPLKDKQKELKKDKRVIRYIGKSERRLESDVQDIIKQLEKDKEINIKNSKLKTIITELTIPANELISKGSLYVGDLKKRLKKMRTDTAIAEKYPSKEHQDLLHTELENLDSEVKILIRWITGLDLALKKAVTFFEEEVQAGIIREINGILADHIEKLRKMYSSHPQTVLKEKIIDGKINQKLYYSSQGDRTLFNLFEEEWSPEIIRKQNDISPDCVNFIKNIHQSIGIIVQKDWNWKHYKDIFEPLLTEMKVLRGKLQKIISEKSRELKPSDNENLTAIYHNIIWSLDTKIRENVGIEKLIEATIKILKREKIKCTEFPHEPMDFGEYDLIKKLFGIPLTGLSQSSDTVNCYSRLINVLKEGLASGIQDEGAINLNIIAGTYEDTPFRYFEPFGILLTEEVNELLSSPLIPQEVIDLMLYQLENKHGFKIRPFGINEVNPFNHPEMDEEKILNNEVSLLLEKNGFGSKFDHRWAHALSNADFFRTIFNKNNRGKSQENLTIKKNISMGFGFRGWYVDKDKKIRSLKITPKMIERLIIMSGNNNRSIDYPTSDERERSKRESEGLRLERINRYKLNLLIKRLREEKLLTPL